MNYYERAQSSTKKRLQIVAISTQMQRLVLICQKAKAYVMKKFTEYGLEPKDCGYGVTATLGHGGKCLCSVQTWMLFQCRKKVENHLHVRQEKKLTHVVMTSCSHILTAAKMLKENEAELEGTVKFMFQPAEETSGWKQEYD